jgi:hypothetical protein
MRKNNIFFSQHFLNYLICSVLLAGFLKGRYNTQHKDIQHNATQHKGLIYVTQQTRLSTYMTEHNNTTNMLSIIMLSVVMMSVIMLSVVMLSIVMLSVVMLSVIMLSVVMLSAVMLSVIMLGVVDPLHLKVMKHVFSENYYITLFNIQTETSDSSWHKLFQFSVYTRKFLRLSCSSLV